MMILSVKFQQFVALTLLLATRSNATREEHKRELQRGLASILATSASKIMPAVIFRIWTRHPKKPFPKFSISRALIYKEPSGTLTLWTKHSLGSFALARVGLREIAPIRAFRGVQRCLNTGAADRFAYSKMCDVPRDIYSQKQML